MDLAFTALSVDVASSLDAQGVFLNIEKNKTKMEAMVPTQAKHVDVMLGLVAEFSETPFVLGREFISPMRGVLHTGHICAQENGLLTVKAIPYNLHELPESFGGMSGGGLWRVYFTEDEKESRIVAKVLCGVASWQSFLNEAISRGDILAHCRDKRLVNSVPPLACNVGVWRASAHGTRKASQIVLLCHCPRTPRDCFFQRITVRMPRRQL